MDNVGRNIGPDEETPSDTYQSPNDRDALHSINSLQNLRLHNGEHTLGPVNGSVMNESRSSITEPPDDTTGPTEEAVHRGCPQGRPQMLNGTGYFKEEKRRLETFADWRYQSIIRKEDLAKNGFIYTGTGDKVICVFCKRILHHWESQDTVGGRHWRNYPFCPFLKGDDVGNIPEPDHTTSMVSAVCGASTCGSDPSRGQHRMNPLRPCIDPNVGQTVAGNAIRSGEGESAGAEGGISFPHPANPTMGQESERSQTFVDWPPQMRQIGDQLARAGFYYMGDGDKVKCFSCGALLFNWEPTDDPFVEHARFSPKCRFLLLVKGENFVQHVHSGTRVEDDVMELPAVQAVLYMGESPESVRKGLVIFREKHGSEAVLTAADLMSIVMELNDDEKSTTHLPSRSMQSKDLENLLRENQILRDRQQCKICRDRGMDVVFNPCKHVVCCASCGASVTVCPICRAPIKSMDRVYIS